jgi:hypothetical protein
MEERILKVTPPPPFSTYPAKLMCAWITYKHYSAFEAEIKFTIYSKLNLEQKKP